MLSGWERHSHHTLVFLKFKASRQLSILILTVFGCACFFPSWALLLCKHDTITVFRPIAYDLFHLQARSSHFLDQHFLRDSVAPTIARHALHLVQARARRKIDDGQSSSRFERTHNV